MSNASHASFCNLCSLSRLSPVPLTTGNFHGASGPMHHRVYKALSSLTTTELGHTKGADDTKRTGVVSKNDSHPSLHSQRHLLRLRDDIYLMNSRSFSISKEGGRVDCDVHFRLLLWRNSNRCTYSLMRLKNVREIKFQCRFDI